MHATRGAIKERRNVAVVPRAPGPACGRPLIAGLEWFGVVLAPHTHTHTLTHTHTHTHTHIHTRPRVSEWVGEQAAWGKTEPGREEISAKEARAG